ncbi:unnamed protein product [Chilo suppressalis]|uniref:Uncharacterized protein n=1 Tax=Chilo suppressalis TaxID=168631 RepID=A0ABN8ARS0_CHISP|nr:unnamed protein product [Chilo suppressalis]
MNLDLDAVADWAKQNYLNLNHTKSKFMVIGSKAQVHKIHLLNPQVSISGQVLEHVVEVRNLDITFDGELRFESHALVLYLLDALDRLQRRAIRNIGDEEVTKHLEPLQLRRDVASLSAFYRLYHGECSEELFSFILPSPFLQRTTRAGLHCHRLTVATIPTRTKKFGDSFLCRSPRSQVHRSPLQPKDTMMRGAGGMLAVTVAALLVCCNADSHQESDNGSEHAVEHYNIGSGGNKLADMDHPGGSFTRQAREAGQYRFVPYLMTRRFDYVSPYGGKRDPWAMSYDRYYGDGLPKRNFDEIDRSNLDTFLRKRNFDEIDQTSMPFPYAKRFYRQSSFDKKRYRPDYPMDEIDLSQFPIGSKRSQDLLQPQH